jgi:hypothetical protein
VSQTDERHEETLATLPAWVAEYAAAQNLTQPAEPPEHMFFTNFFVSRNDWWRRAEVRSA